MFLRSLSFLLLSFLLPAAHGLSSFPQKLRVGKPEGSVTLSCTTDYEGKVFWTHNKNRVAPSAFREHGDRELTLHEIDSPDTGNYSCWAAAGQLLDHMHLVLEEQPEEEDTDLVLCTAKSYSCTFSCSWSPEGYALARVRYQRSDEGGPSAWVYARPAQPSAAHEGTFHFTLTHSSSPFAEERQPLVLTAEALSSKHYRQRTAHFYIRDIIQPDAPQAVVCQRRRGHSLSVTVHPPQSWVSPHSYFPLGHEIEYVYQDNGKTERSTNGVIPKGVSKLRVRSRDLYFPSQWSQWSPWKNLRGQDKGVQTRHRQDQEAHKKRRAAWGAGTIHCRRRRKAAQAPDMGLTGGL
uniref:Interleukin-12 subunit beta n=1 Tax=Lepisosteus oculatus TaxID=7918 RepID=W5LYQ9_LEPOC|nr:PREDICTED: interleukin-12 subunit beta-like [Lepisosteus oculatus]